MCASWKLPCWGIKKQVRCGQTRVDLFGPKNWWIRHLSRGNWGQSVSETTVLDNEFKVSGSIPLSLTNQSARDFSSIYSVAPPPPPKVAHTHTHSHSLKGRDIREIWQSAESLDDALSQGKSHALNVCFGIEPATILLNILSHLPSTIWSTFSNASSTFPCSSFFSGHRNELCFMAS